MRRRWSRPAVRSSRQGHPATALRPLGFASGVALLAVLAAAGWGIVSFSQPRPCSQESARQAWSALAGGAHVAGARLWGVAWGPKEPHEIPGSREMRAVVRQMSMDGQRGCASRCLANLALLKLMTHQPSAAADLLERATETAPNDPAAWSDLAAARLAVAERSGSALPLVGALAAGERALAIEPHREEALFNYALALDRLHLVDLTRAAWGRYLQTDTTSPWADEARRRLLAVPAGTDRRRWRLDFARLAAADPRGADMVEQVAATVSRSPLEARLAIEETTLPAWARASERGDVETAGRQLRLAAAFGEALASAGSDPLIAAAVDAIHTAQATADVPRLHSLARGHLAYADGMDLYKASADRQALARFADAAKLLAQGRSPFAAWARFRAAICRYYDGDNAGVLSSASRLLEDATAAHQPALAGRAALLAGMASFRLARFGRSARFYRSALTEFAGIGETEHVAAAHFMLAEVLKTEGELDQAWDDRLAALALSHSLGDSIYYYNSLYDAAGALRLAGQHRMALLFENEMAHFAARRGDPLLLTETLIDRARTRARLGDLAGARRDLTAAAASLTRVGLGERHLRLDTELRLAQAEMAAETREALAALTAAIDLARQRHDEFRLPALYERRARSQLRVGHLDDASIDLLAGIEECERQRERLSGEQLDGAFLDQRQAVYQEMVRLQLRLGAPERALAFAERGRTRDLLETLVAGGTEGGDRIARGVASAAAIAQALPSGTALLEFAVFPDLTEAWLITREGLVARELPIGEANLGLRVDRLRGQIRRGEGTVPAESRELFELLIRPLAGILDRCTALVFVADGPLARLPFAALWDGRGRHFLIERWAVSAAPSATLYLHALRHGAQLPHATPANVLVVTSPALAGTDYASLPALPAARAEAEDVAASYPHADQLSGRGATVPAFLDAAPGHDVVHVATHAVLNEAYPLLSAIPLAPTSPEAADGALYAYEIYQLRLPRTRLVVLAGCDTGSGRLSRTEGANSLARAFLATGVPAVISSLWAIDDDPAARFSVELHRRLVSGDDAVAALRAAQLALLTSASLDLRLPRSWAAYQLIGGVASGPVH